MLHALGFALGLMAASTATADSWNFTLTDLCRSEPGLPDLCIDVHGRFSGNDLDADGVVSLPELTALDAEGWQFYPGFSGPLSGATTASFSYQRGGPLSFAGYASSYRVQAELVTGVGYTLNGPIPEAGTYAWTPATRVLVSPVPEPSPVVLALAGLLGLSGFLRQHRLTKDQESVPSSVQPRRGRRSQRGWRPHAGRQTKGFRGFRF